MIVHQRSHLEVLELVAALEVVLETALETVLETLDLHKPHMFLDKHPSRNCTQSKSWPAVNT